MSDVELEFFASLFEAPLEHVFDLIRRSDTHTDEFEHSFAMLAGRGDAVVGTAVLRESLLSMQPSTTPRRQLSHLVNSHLKSTGRATVTEAAVSLQRTARRNLLDALVHLAPPIVQVLRQRTSRLVHVLDLPEWGRALMAERADSKEQWGDAHDAARVLLSLALGPVPTPDSPAICGRPVLLSGVDVGESNDCWLADRNLLATPDQRDITLIDIVKGVLSPIDVGPSRRSTRDQFKEALINCGVSPRSVNRFVSLLEGSDDGPSVSPRFLQISHEAAYVFDRDDRRSSSTRSEAKARLDAEASHVI